MILDVSDANRGERGRRRDEGVAFSVARPRLSGIYCDLDGRITSIIRERTRAASTCVRAPRRGFIASETDRERASERECSPRPGYKRHEHHKQATKFIAAVVTSKRITKFQKLSSSYKKLLVSGG